MPSIVFESLKAGFEKMTSNQRLIIIGGDAAGMSAASQVRRRTDWDVVAFERGEFTSYSA
ncbi:hypothetical protein BH23CHL2_BH23CHL2_19870 [soil metagenome]